jgi:hypothetical protein
MPRDILAGINAGAIEEIELGYGRAIVNQARAGRNTLYGTIDRGYRRRCRDII